MMQMRVGEVNSRQYAVDADPTAKTSALKECRLEL